MKDSKIFAMNEGKEAGLSLTLAIQDFHRDGVPLYTCMYVFVPHAQLEVQFKEIA